MASYPPPTEIVSIFNEFFFEAPNASISMADVANNYLRKNTSDIATGFITFNNSLAVNGSFYYNGSIIDLTGLGYVSGITPGTVSASKAIVVDSNKDISAFRNLTATNLTGTLQTAAQPNITSIGTLSSLIVSGLSSTSNTRMITTTNYNGIMDTASIVLKQSSTTNGNKVGIDFAVTTNTIDSVNTATCSIYHERIAVYQGDLIFATKRTAIADSALIEALRISSTGTCSIANTSSGFQLNLGASGTGINTNALTTTSLTLGATAITSTGTELNYLDLTAGPGTAEASKAVVVDSNKDISAFRNLTATGTITSLVAIATTMTVSGVDLGSNIAPLVGVTLGTPAASKALTLNASSQIDGSLSLTGNLTANNLTGTLQTAAQPNITSIGTLATLTATNITGTLQTAAQPNITSIGTLTSITTSGTLTMGSTVISAAEIGVIDGVTAGTASASKALVVDSSKNIAGVNVVRMDSDLYMSQAAVLRICRDVSTGDLNSTIYSDGIASLCLSSIRGGGQVKVLTNANSTNNCFTINNATSGTNHLTMRADSKTGLYTNTPGYGLDVQSSLNCTSLYLNGTQITASATELNVLAGITAGAALASKALVLDSSKNIIGINNLTSNTVITTSLSATNLTGTNLISSNSYSTSGVSTKVASLYGHQAFGSINTNGSYVSAGISFLNASSDQMPQASIVLDRKALDQGDLCIYTQSPTFNLSETARFLSTGALSINTGASPIAMISCIGSGSYLYGTQYQRLLHLKSNHATPVKFEVSLNKNTAATSTNECLVGTTTANDLYIGTDSTYRMCIKATTNYVGIGDNASSIDKVFGILNGTVGSGVVDMRFGNALSSNNCFTMTYAPTSSGSGLNRLQFDPYGSSGALTILAKKYIGIGTTGPVCPLDVAGSESGLGILAPYQYAGNNSGDGGYVASGTTTGVNINAIFRSNVIFDDKIYIRSDRRVKKDIVPLTVDLGVKFVKEVEPVLFRKKDQPETSIQEIGYIAQDVMKAGFGNIITHTDNDKMKIEEEGDIENIQFNVDYSRVCAILHSVVKDQQKRIESLTRRLERLEQLSESDNSSIDIDIVQVSPGNKFALKKTKRSNV